MYQSLVCRRPETGPGMMAAVAALQGRAAADGHAPRWLSRPRHRGSVPSGA